MTRTVSTPGVDGRMKSFVVAFDDAVKAFDAPEAIVRRIIDEVVLPAFERNWASSGLKSHSGILKAALTKPGAKGNLIVVRGAHGEAGIDDGVLPWATYALQGRGPVKPVKAKALSWVDDGGTRIFRKSVGPAPPREVVYLTSDDLQRAAEIAAEMCT